MLDFRRAVRLTVTVVSSRSLRLSPTVFCQAKKTKPFFRLMRIFSHVKYAQFEQIYR